MPELASPTLDDTAKKIIDWRNANGRFSRVEQLREIDGIGERRFAQLQELVRV